jgi:hypothetical protein
MDQKKDKMENLMDQRIDSVNQRIDSMNQNMDKMMQQLQNSILHTMDERFPKGDIKTQGNHENVEEIKIESQNHDYSSLQDPHHRGFNAAPRNYLIPKIDMRKFDGKDPITWIF